MEVHLAHHTGLRVCYKPSLKETYDMTEPWGRRDRVRCGVAAWVRMGVVATLALSGCDADDTEGQELSVMPSIAQAVVDQEVSLDDSMRLLRKMAGWAGTHDASAVSVWVARGDAPLASVHPKNALVVRDNGSMEFRFEANSEAEGKELFGFFAQAILHGVDDAEQAACVDVERSAS